MCGKLWPGHKGLYVDDRSVRPDEFLKYSVEELEEICDAARPAAWHAGGAEAPAGAIARSEADETPEAIDVVITMGGLGSRFRKAGYTVPKYMIEAKGKTLFEWSLISLEGYKDRVDKFVFLAMEGSSALKTTNSFCWTT